MLARETPGTLCDAVVSELLWEGLAIASHATPLLAAQQLPNPCGDTAHERRGGCGCAIAEQHLLMRGRGVSRRRSLLKRAAFFCGSCRGAAPGLRLADEAGGAPPRHGYRWRRPWHDVKLPQPHRARLAGRGARLPTPSSAEARRWRTVGAAIPGKPLNSPRRTRQERRGVVLIEPRARWRAARLHKPGWAFIS